jgi:hypothetical protein
MDQLMDKLIKSKAIMDRHDGMKRSNSVSESSYSSMPMAQDFDIPQAKYNIPQEFLQEQQVQQPYLSQVPNTKPVGVPSVDAIKNSKLPDEIKKLMMEHPISQPQQPQMTLSSELIEKASRLMKESNGNYVPESAKPKQQTSQSQPQVQSQGIDYKVIQKMINEAVRNALKENGLVTESTEKTNEMFTFKVGKHQFEGRVTKVKKLS